MRVSSHRGCGIPYRGMFGEDKVTQRLGNTLHYGGVHCKGKFWCPAAQCDNSLTTISISRLVSLSVTVPYILDVVFNLTFVQCDWTFTLCIVEAVPAVCGGQLSAADSVQRFASPDYESGMWVPRDFKDGMRHAWDVRMGLSSLGQWSPVFTYSTRNFHFHSTFANNVLSVITTRIWSTREGNIFSLFVCPPQGRGTP